MCFAKLVDMTNICSEISLRHNVLTKKKKRTKERRNQEVDNSVQAFDCFNQSSKQEKRLS
jgi:hypothetical protein